MPNGDDHSDPRPIWERVKDLQGELEKRADEITTLMLRVEELEKDKEALLNTIRLLKEGD